jgi:hypothetical protein
MPPPLAPTCRFVFSHVTFLDSASQPFSGNFAAQPVGSTFYMAVWGHFVGGPGCGCIPIPEVQLPGTRATNSPVIPCITPGYFGTDERNWFTYGFTTTGASIDSATWNPLQGGGLGGGGGGGGGTGGGGAPSAFVCPAPSKPASINIGDIIQWLGNIVYCAFQDIITAIHAAFGSLDIGKALKDFWDSIFKDWAKFWDALRSLFTEPDRWLGDRVDGIFKEQSAPVSHRFVDGVWKLIHDFSNKYGGKYPVADPSKGDMLAEVKAFIDSIGADVGTPTSPDTVQARLEELDTKVFAIISGTFAAQAAAEAIPTLSRAGTAGMVMAWLEARGVYSIACGILEPYLQHNIVKNLDYRLNEFYHDSLPDLGTMIQLYNRDLYSLGTLDLLGSRVSGLDSATIHQIQKSTRAPPSLAEFQLFNRRNPGAGKDWNRYEDLLQLDFTRFGDVYAETAWTDISLRFIQQAANLLKFDEPKIRRLYQLQGVNPNVDTVLGMSALDIYTTITLDRQKLYQQAIEGESKATKHFGYALLIKLAQDGIDITDVMSDDLTAEGWDDTHRGKLEQFIKDVVAAKLAKKASGEGVSASGG